MSEANMIERQVRRRLTTIVVKLQELHDITSQNNADEPVGLQDFLQLCEIFLMKKGGVA